jgi:hypothetical protein
MPRGPRLQTRDIAAEIVRHVAEANAQTGRGYVVRLSEPPTPQERPQLMAALRESVAYTLGCATVRYCNTRVMQLRSKEGRRPNGTFRISAELSTRCGVLVWLDFSAYGARPLLRS